MTLLLCIILFWCIICSVECSVEAKRLRVKNKELESQLAIRDKVVRHFRNKTLELEAEILRQRDIIRRSRR